MSKYLIFFLLLMISNRAFSSVKLRGSAELLNPQAYAAGIQSSLFTTSALLDNDGKELALPDATKFQKLDTKFNLAYGISKKLESSLFINWREVSASYAAGSTINTSTHSAPESIGFSAKYAFDHTSDVLYAVGLHYLKTLYTNTEYANQTLIPANEIILGDDGTEFGIGFFTTLNRSSWKWDGSLEYVSPPNNLSSEVHYDFSGRYLFSKLSFVGGVEGIYSLNRDQNTSKPFLAKGPTNIFNSLNRQQTAPYIGADYSFEKFILSLKGQSVLFGRSTDKGNSLIVALNWNTEGITNESVKVDNFKEYHIEGSVLKISARGNFIKIDQGLSTDVEKGMKFDLYQTDYFGGNILVGTGIVYEVGSNWSVIKLVKKYQEIEILPGFAARGY